jgi:DnaK suppressor protein
VKAKPVKNTKVASPAKAAVKAAAKSAIRPVAKATRSAAKPAAKPEAKPATKKPVKAGASAKASSLKNPVRPASASAVKVAAGSSARKAAKSAAKPVSKGSAKPTVARAAPKAAKTGPKTPPAHLAKAAAKATSLKVKPALPVQLAATKVPATAAVVAAPVASPAKAGRPSSRLAQLTVPSMAQAVASTAAKASYSQATISAVIVPALPATVKKDAKLANNWKIKPVADLTDAELLAMPDSEYMNEVQLSAFRIKLTNLKRDILNSAGETTEHLREDTSVVPDPADRATIEEEHALELRTRDRERKLLKKIEQSIARIDAGDYGYCDETGEPIGVGRLLARPTATLSLEAQQRRELKQKMFGD